jgi:hypothetical protein
MKVICLVSEFLLQPRSRKKYGYKYPEVKDYALKNSSGYKKVYKHFTVKAITIMLDHMSKALE